MRGLLATIARMKLVRCTRAATAVEYGFLIALIVLAIIVTLTEVATKTSNMWNNVNNCVQTAGSSECPLSN